MEFTETEIKMFAEAEEIQAEWEPTDGDFLMHKKGYRIYVLVEIDVSGSFQKLAVCNKEWLMGSDRAPKWKLKWVYMPDDWEFELSEKFEDFASYNLSEVIWLPTQEQLQGMTKAQLIDFVKLAYFKNWVYATRNEESIRWTMRQLWLAFVMHKKYQKTWNGETWVKETSS